jgi:hypothetical protein
MYHLLCKTKGRFGEGTVPLLQFADRQCIYQYLPAPFHVKTISTLPDNQISHLHGQYPHYGTAVCSMSSSLWVPHFLQTPVKFGQTDVSTFNKLGRLYACCSSITQVNILGRTRNKVEDTIPASDLFPHSTEAAIVSILNTQY